MCKLLIITSITEGLVVREFMERMAKPMSRVNDDGIGYAAVNSRGELFSERWLNNDHFFSTKDVMVPEIAKELEAYTARLPKGALDPNYSVHGEVDFNDVRSVIMHTRMATCGKEFANTHPFIYEDTAQVHNGVIRNAFSWGAMKGLDVNKISTCDSEAALQTYLSQGVNRDTKKAKEWLDMLTGSWAFGILTRNEQGNRVLDVVRGSSSLYYMEIEGIGRVFTTQKDDAEGVAKDMGLKFLVEPGFVGMDEMYRYDALTGEFLEAVDIKPKYSYSYNYSKGGGNTTTSGSSSRSSSSRQSDKAEGVLNVFKPGQALLDLMSSVADDPEAFKLLPDIFTTRATAKNPEIDYRKVKTYCNLASEPFIERIEIFDLVFNTSYLAKYTELPNSLREEIRFACDSRGMKAARQLINDLSDSSIKHG